MIVVCLALENGKVYKKIRNFPKKDQNFKKDENAVFLYTNRMMILIDKFVVEGHLSSSLISFKWLEVTLVSCVNMNLLIRNYFS